MIWRPLAHTDNLAPTSKTLLITHCVHLPSPCLFTAVDWIKPAEHQEAVIAFFVGDFFLGRYAGNHFCKSLVPKNASIRAACQADGQDPSRMCITCWLERDNLHFEDESHMLFDCPSYASQRADLLREIHPSTLTRMLQSDSRIDSIVVLLTSDESDDWNALRRYLARIRQIRRRSRRRLSMLQHRHDKYNLAAYKAAWKACGKGMWKSCGLGLVHAWLLRIMDGSEAHWTNAKYMSHVDPKLKALMVAPFKLQDFKWLGQNLAELKRRVW